MENRGAEAVEEQESKKLEMDLEGRNDLSNQKKKRYSWIPRFACARLDDGDVAVAEKPDARGFDVSNRKDQSATHLILMVNGIIGSAQNWRYAAKQFVKAYPSEVVVHCSDSNSSLLTLDGVDVMGKRLADEVISVVSRHSNLEKISFVGHSLGGLVARYAIAVLYQKDLTRKDSDENGECGGDELVKSPLEEKTRGKIAGLEPMNFITIATPHLGARGHRQIPVLCGFRSLEKAALHASGVLRRTGKHLFLRDDNNEKPPLLLQMTEDSDELKFISALQSFTRRVAYANISFDHIVGWSSSSLRRLNELPKRRNLVKIAKYKYIFAEDTSKTADIRETKVSRGRISEMEEAMIGGLTRLSWERVDVDFSTSIQGPLAHTTIQVKTYCINSHGANVIQHMIDNFQL
ncbi:putative lipase YDL109C [Salvia miltiorrhiza]|uniref:putative lipase YDL109C n=1 Tax=Salvia miltiorrhiza TaxID=226208 RepID=UPI0025AC2D1E|nr:putative lipase YDL109C [Salvia miltiorrhiza]XP_057794273.1 putative lipase YDL109C [Salvia miltiorrhiza]XP_057794274.1 putative lipase YDL109C [Salvia miltiorrhiza]